jgi:hypothetical protein
MTIRAVPARAHAVEAWPSLPYAAWRDTYATLHMWAQIVGKIRMGLTPPQNHWWHAPLYVSARGLTSGLVPSGARGVEIEFDFLSHRLHVRTSDGAAREMPLRSQTVAAFYAELMEALRSLGIAATVWTRPQEVVPAIPFEEDEVHASYDPEYAHRLGQILRSTNRVFWDFSSRFKGKRSPSHFFWGSFDLAVTRFSGHPAPRHPGGVPGLADWVVREAYSHEVSSAGWWPGGDGFPEPAYYAYAYPEPAGYRDAWVEPAGAAYDARLREFILPYETVRRSADPAGALMAFLQSTYEAAADRAGWDRSTLERRPVPDGSA